ncbi:putative sulfate exporter family transporter [Aquincola sp. S2]|uniref:Sulfate exporter family transporter n=1 Tax=Pseudaquabacterium terrae TaxID=2732868 RepID=A0ABX2EF29_9BURK|nr:putative sulfate exporter family transporter [Aquabacterium terrae]NRF67219.1 putative sulfate exporter family transporter [Aquabacterium terrae]
MSTALALSAWPARGRTLFPGVLASVVVAAAATFLSQHYGAPVMLFALLLGLAMNFLSGSSPPTALRAGPPEGERPPWGGPAAAAAPCAPGIEFTARQVLRIGVALLGLRITLAQIAALGIAPVGIVIISVVLTIGLSMLAARALGFNTLFGLLSGGATAICGASAAMALAAALPAHPQKERATLFTVVGVSALSTLAMIVYPMAVRAFGLDARGAGVFLGGTIHDVAQVVGAGYSLSQETGDVATFVKLLRVAMLLPVIVFAVLLARRGSKGAAAGPRPPLLPGFVVGFAALVGLASTGWLPQPVLALGNDVSRWCLVAAIAAIGMKTQLKELATVGFKPVALMLGETVFLAILVLALVRWLP